jgi:cytochrome P450
MSRIVPRVPGRPVTGNLGELARNRIELLTRLPEQYGDVARIDIGFLARAYVVSSPELAHETLVTHEGSFVKSLGLTLFGKPLLGEGLVSSQGDLHRRQRRMMAPAFMPKRIAAYAQTMASYADASVQRLGRADTVDLSREMMQLTFEIVGKTLFDADVSGDAKVVGDALTTAMETFTRQISSVIPLPPAVPSPSNLRAKKSIRRLDDLVYRIIRERRTSGVDAGDFLSMLLAARDEDGSGGMSDKQVRDEAMTILMAGHETVSTALSWTFYLLAKHPHVRARLEDEVDRVLGGSPPSLALLPKLPYAMQVFKEAMRVYPPVYMVLRRATREMTIGEVELRKNDLVIVNVIGMHRRAEYFPDPLRFDPDRFAPEAERVMTKHAYLPFGGGPRVCIGNHFALMEGQIVLAHLAQHMRFDLSPGHDEIGFEPLVTLRPKGGVHVRIHRRGPDDRPVDTAAE